jgi:hypothetical protein
VLTYRRDARKLFLSTEDDIRLVITARSGRQQNPESTFRTAKLARYSGQRIACYTQPHPQRTWSRNMLLTLESIYLVVASASAVAATLTVPALVGLIIRQARTGTQTAEDSEAAVRHFLPL